MARILSVYLIAFLISVCGARAGQDRTVTITIENKTPEFVVVPSIEVFGGETQPFAKLDNNKFEYKFHVDESEWFNTVDIKLEWKQAFLEVDGNKTDFSQRIKLRIRRDFPPGFSVPVFFSNARSNKEMSRLENERDATEQFEVFFRAWQIAAYYRTVNGATSPYAKRASQIFLYAAVALAEHPNYFVEMSDEAEKFVADAFGEKRFAARVNQARSAYWHDLNEVDKYVANGDCETARLLMKAFHILANERPDEFDAQFEKAPNILTEKDRLVSLKCDNH